MAIQIEAAMRFGWKRAQLESAYGDPSVYIDEKKAGQALGHFTDRFIDQTMARDLAHAFDLSLFGATERVIRLNVAAILTKKAAIVLTSTGTIIKSTPDLDAFLDAMDKADRHNGGRKARLMAAGRRRLGTKTGPKPKFNAADWEKLRAIWLVAKTQREFILMAKDAGLKISYSHVDRRARGNPDENGEPTLEPWPLRGSGKTPKPKKRRRSR